MVENVHLGRGQPTDPAGPDPPRPFGLLSAKLPALTELDFCCNRLPSDDAASSIAGAPWYTGLRRLRLEFDAGAMSRVAQERLLNARLDGLAHLEVSGMTLDDGLLYTIVDAAPNMPLQTLSLVFEDEACSMGAWDALADGPMPHELYEFVLDCGSLSRDVKNTLYGARWSGQLTTMEINGEDVDEDEDDEDEDEWDDYYGDDDEDEDEWDDEGDDEDEWEEY